MPAEIREGGKTFKKEVVHSSNTVDNLIKVRTKATKGFGNRKAFNEFYRQNMKNWDIRKAGGDWGEIGI